MSKLVKQLPEDAWQETLRKYEHEAVFWHERVDDDTHTVQMALVLRGGTFVYSVPGYHFESIGDAEIEACRLNRILGYDLIQMIRLKCGHLNREQGEPIVFSGRPPNCTAKRDRY